MLCVGSDQGEKKIREEKITHQLGWREVWNSRLHSFLLGGGGGREMIFFNVGVSEITFSSPSRLRLCFGLCICMRGGRGEG